MSEENEATVLSISIHGELVGFLAGYKNGRNVFSFAESFRHNPNRPTFGLITHPEFPNASKLMASSWSRNQRLHPLFSNLLPEGALREILAQTLKVHVNNEFHLLTHLGSDLPGAIKARPMEPEDVPDHVLNTHGKARAVRFDQIKPGRKFSLAGVQMKFSMKEKDGRYNLSDDEVLGDWILKTPSTKHPFVPLNEFTAMSLAKLAGVDVPDIKLVELSQLDNLPLINLPNESKAFAIKRFDRQGNQRIHMEDFAQVLVKYPHEKYSSAHYEGVAKVIYDYSSRGLSDAQQLAKRLLVNILLANGDAHLKNWSLLYPDKVSPRLSPAYDIVTTSVYFKNETQFALNLGKTKEWYSTGMAQFEAWAQKSGLPWTNIKSQLVDTIGAARALWPEAIRELPMHETQKENLKTHWRRLDPEFRIDTTF
jgi:serine/threonine-protein kinase HipA